MSDYVGVTPPNYTPYFFVTLALIVINVVGFVVCGIDKYKAKRSLWRIPESTFFWLVLMGGAIGVYVGFLLFRHKTRHRRFMLGVPMIFILQVTVLIFIYLTFYT
ncbi:MAG: DUF1294 domain-containing protein [Clostridium sp.]|nr:DUF1294 domain-containing protein [Clostridium sp.]